MNLKAFFRPTAFRVGYVIGLAFVLLIVAMFQDVSDGQPDFDLEIIGVGADLDAHRVRELVLQTDRGVLFSQTCRGGCDDLWQRARVPEGAYDLRVLDQSGACVVCSTAGYVSSGLPSGWRLRGRERLDGTAHFLKDAPETKLKDWRPGMPTGG